MGFCDTYGHHRIYEDNQSHCDMMLVISQITLIDLIYVINVMIVINMIV